MFGLRSRAVLLGACCASITCHVAAQNGPSSSLPGKGLAQHDFLYAGESHDRRIFIVRHGKIVWNYEDPSGKGEVSDAVMLSNGNVLFTHQFGFTEITPEKKVIWTYDAPAGHEVHTAVPIGKERVIYIQNGNPAVLRVVNTETNVIEKEITLATRIPASTHGQFRHARLTDRGTLLVAHMDLNKVVEYDSQGRELWSFPASNPWGVTPFTNGNVLITDRVGVREITHVVVTACGVSRRPMCPVIHLRAYSRRGASQTEIRSSTTGLTNGPRRMRIDQAASRRSK